MRMLSLAEEAGPFVMTGAQRRQAAVLDRRAFRTQSGVAEVIGLVGLTGLERRKVRSLSGGQKRRLDLALGLIGNPALLYLDEPTTGFDPAARRDAWQLVRGLRTAGMTILLTTHDMDEAQALADRVVLLSGGVVVAAGEPAVLPGQQRRMIGIRLAADPPGFPLGCARAHAEKPQVNVVR